MPLPSSPMPGGCAYFPPFSKSACCLGGYKKQVRSLQKCRCSWGSLAKRYSISSKALTCHLSFLCLAGTAPSIASSQWHCLSQEVWKRKSPWPSFFPEGEATKKPKAIKSIIALPSRRASKALLWPHRSAIKQKINRPVFYLMQKNQHWPLALSVTFTEIYSKNGGVQSLIPCIQSKLFFCPSPRWQLWGRAKSCC